MSDTKQKFDSLEVVLQLPEAAFDDLLFQALDQEEDFCAGSFVHFKVQALIGLSRKRATPDFVGAVKRSMDRLVEAGKLVRYGKGAEYPSITELNWRRANGHNVMIGTVALRDRSVVAIEKAKQEEKEDISKRDKLIRDVIQTGLEVEPIDRFSVKMTVADLATLVFNFREAKRAAEWFASNKPGTPVPEWIDEALMRVPHDTGTT